MKYNKVKDQWRVREEKIEKEISDKEQVQDVLLNSNFKKRYLFSILKSFKDHEQVSTTYGKPPEQKSAMMNEILDLISRSSFE